MLSLSGLLGRLCLILLVSAEPTAIGQTVSQDTDLAIYGNVVQRPVTNGYSSTLLEARAAALVHVVAASPVACLHSKVEVPTALHFSLDGSSASDVVDQGLQAHGMLGLKVQGRWRLITVALDGVDRVDHVCSVALANYSRKELPICSSVAACSLLAGVKPDGAVTMPTGVRIVEHNTSVTVGINPRTGADVTAHTWHRVMPSSQRPSRRQAGDKTNGLERLHTSQGSIRILSFNTWNSNPPRWLWREPHDRMRQYALRLAHAGDVLRHAAADVLALQEVRFDSTLGGRDEGDDMLSSQPAPGQDRHDDDDELDSRPFPPNFGPLEARASYAHTLALAETWYNRTRAIGSHPAYVARNERRWQAVVSSPHFASLVSQHPFEGSPISTVAQSDTASGNVTSSSSAGTAGRYPSPYARGMPRGEGVRLSAVRRALRKHPHSQVEHIAASLPGYQYVSTPAQLYLDPARWLHEGEPHRDEEGPAIFSRWPILRHNYMLLSRDAGDEGDGHQRAVLHALIQVQDNRRGCNADGTHVAGAAAADAETAAANVDSRANESSEKQPSECLSADADAPLAGASELSPPLLLDVYTVHLSLSEAARNRTVRELVAFVRATAAGAVQVLAGDMNAEPHEAAMEWLARGSTGTIDSEKELPKVCKFSDHGWRLCQLDKGKHQNRHSDEPAALHAVDTAAATVAVAADGSVAPLVPSLTAAANSSTAWPVFSDAFALAFGGSVPEPPPRSSDAALRRYAFTFPSDDPVKRIDLVLVATHPDHAVLAQAAQADSGEAAKPDATAASDDHVSLASAAAAPPPAAVAAAPGSGSGNPADLDSRWRVSVMRHFLMGQDPLPGTDTMEGLGAGMLSQRSPIYASDHRAVVVDLQLEAGAL